MIRLFVVLDCSVSTGGGLMDDNAEVWNTIIELGGGKGFARFGVISAASEVLLTYKSIIKLHKI